LAGEANDKKLYSGDESGGTRVWASRARQCSSTSCPGAEQERHQRLVERVAKQTFHEDRFAQTEEENRRLDETVSALRHILRSGLASEPHVDFSSMYQHPKESALDSNAALRLPQEPFETDYSPKTPGWFGQLFPWVMHAALFVCRRNTGICYIFEVFAVQAETCRCSASHR
jgi:hypothetical protein